MTHIIPSISDEGVVLPWSSVAIYAVYSSAVVLMLVTGMIHMDCIAIPSEMLVPVVLAIVLACLFSFMVLYLVGYQEKKSKVLELRANAMKNGQPVDEVAMAKVQSFNNIYVCALLVGAGISAAVAYLAMISIVPANLTVESEVDYILWSAVSAVAASLLLDRFFVHPIADGTFKSKVIDPLTDSIIAEFQTDDKKAPALSDDQVNALIGALQNIIRKD